ncbi:MAG: kynureninase [Planctomycetota bacterium]|jgi:kynureninase
MSTAGSLSSIDSADFEPDESFALRLDEHDPLREFRARFHLPPRPDGEPAIYFCGNSLGLQPTSVQANLEQELEAWARLAVDAHLGGRRPWYSYHEIFSDSVARLVGARPGEVVIMNSLTVNIHLMLVSFFQPTPDRHCILMEHPAFPSDLYAIRTHLRGRGLDPADSVVQIRPRAGEHTVRTEDLETLLDEQGPRIALVWLGGVNFFTGQVFDMPRITAAARRHGCVVGFDLAHAAGNVPLQLHDWDVDFAAWCSYKYLNAGPGAVAGCFVHERHGADGRLPRYAGWWGDDPETRFQMHLKEDFVAQPGAAGWQISNPPILAMAPLRASLDIFDEAGMEALRRKSVLLTGYLRYLLERAPSERFEIITPAEPDAQGCQLSVLVHDQPHTHHEALLAEGVVCDFREPNVIRVAPAPLYNTFHEVWRFSRILLGRR